MVGGYRYTTALLIDSVGGGLLRPFLLLYGITVLGLSGGQAGVALSAGLLAGLAALPIVGRWIDRGSRSAVVAATLLVRVAGVVVLLVGNGQIAYFVASILLGLGFQTWPAAHAALVATLTTGRERDAALAAGRSVRNAGLGVGALIATVAVAGGGSVLRGLAAATALGFLISGLLVYTMRLDVAPQHDKVAVERGSLGGLTILMWANLPFALCFAVLEVALPALVVTQLDVSPAWSAGMFVGNTVVVIAFGVPVVIWLSKMPRRTVFAMSGAVLALSYLGFWAGAGLGGTTGAAAVALVCVLYTMGEILYTGSGTALVIASAPANLLGRALVRWQLSTGVGMAIAPAVLMGLLTVGPWALWGALALATLAAAVIVMRHREAGPLPDHGDQGVL
ncbi:MAG TPA: MFS transporter, partial [Micromonosporaceae bacterium]|nr:MFS transporter [Micromonosporaceae bacterium]